jgi:hypothetical protein
MLSFRSKTSDRWSAGLTRAGLVDMALRGTEEQWWELHHTARRDAELRALLARLLHHADPDLAGGRRLWLALLDRMDATAATGAPGP